MSKENLAELVDLARRLEAQLKFYGDLGVTDIGGGAVRRASVAAPEPQTAAQSLPVDQQVPAAATQTTEVHAPPAGTAARTGLFQESAGGTSDYSKGRPATPSIKSAPDPSLEAIRQEIGDCVRCKLHTARKHIVFGEGDPQAKLVFVGEGPGADEDASGRPFVGRAGQLLNKIIEAIGLKREEVYICNVVKCRPPGNRNPEPDEVATCEPFLFRQLAFIQPRVIVTLGLPAFQCLLKSKESIGRARGHWREWNGIRVMPTFHPAYLLRSPDKKREAWEDMKKVRDYLGELGI